MESIWEMTTEIPGREQLSGGRNVQAAVIGGGLAGILTAYFLKQAGMDVLVIEGSRIGSGQTGRTTAKITVSHGLIYENLIREMGLGKAQQYAFANQEALRHYKRLIEEKKIDCDFEECTSYLYSVMEEKEIWEETRAAEKLGLGAKFTLQTELPFQVRAAIAYKDQARFHPLKFLKAVSEELDIVENTPVERVEGGVIETKYGNVKAEHIIFASHFPFINVPGFYFMRMHQERSYAAAFTGCPRMKDMYLGVDPCPGSHVGNYDGRALSFRGYGDYLLLGGYGHRTGENEAGGQYKRLEEAANSYWPGCRLKTAWSAQDCMTIDEVPYIGKYSAKTANWYVATGFRKWGMTSCMAAATVITGMITGAGVPYAEVFSPQRFQLGTAVPEMFKEGVHSAKSLIAQNFSLPKEKVDEIPAGHGGVVQYQGEKVGVYKDESGEPHFVTTRCPHLGCQLTWNPQELSWDCPCHGSRFDYRGNLLDNPAQEGICDETISWEK